MKSDTYESDLKRVTKAFEEMVTAEETRCDTNFAIRMSKFQPKYGRLSPPF
jgi:hypothetical protein